MVNFIKNKLPKNLILFSQQDSLLYLLKDNLDF